MEKDTRLLCYHLDNIRRQRKISVEELTSDICTDRQYRRYISGESIIPSTKLVTLCERLDISLSDFFYSLLQKDRLSFGTLSGIYKLITNGNVALAKTNLDFFLKKNNQIDRQNKKLIEYLKLRIQFESTRSLDSNILVVTKDKVNFGYLRGKEIYDFVDVLNLHLLVRLEVNKRKTESIDLLYKILQSDESIYISSENKFILPPIYANLSNYLGRVQKYDESLTIAEEGVKYCITNNLSDSLPHLYYSKMLGLFHKNQLEKTYLSAIECLSACISTNKSLYSTYYGLIKSDLGSDPIKYFLHLDLDLLMKT